GPVQRDDDDLADLVDDDLLVVRHGAPSRRLGAPYEQPDMHVNFLGKAVVKVRRVEDRPTASEVLQAISELLQDEVLPVLDGGLQHKVRVAANLCRIVERELRLGPDAAERERQ